MPAAVRRRTDWLHQRHRLYLERALAATLGLVIAFFLGFKRLPVRQTMPVPRVILHLEVEEVPVTRQGRGSPAPPPRRPAVPVAAESESFPEDEEVGPGVALGSQAGLAGQEGAEVGSLFFLPRAIREVFPEFPARLRGKVRGVVELMLRIGPTGEVEEVLVVRNTTGSQELEKAAVEAARRCVFVAPRDQYGRPVSVWAPKVYAFE